MFQAVLVLLLALSASAAFAAPSNFDRADQSGRDPRVAAATRRLRSDPALSPLGRIAHIDERYGVPSFVWANPGTAPAAGATREAAARAHLAAVAPLYGLDADDVREATLRHVHDTGRGGIVASFIRQVDGIEVYRDRIQVLMDRSLQPVAVSGYIPARSTEIVGRFRLSEAAAIEQALADFGGRSRLTPGREPTSRKVYFHEGMTLVPGWHIELMGQDQAFAYVISADDGALLYRCSLMANDSFGYRVWADATPAHAPYDGPQTSAPTPHPAGIISAYDPPYVAPSLISLQNSPFSMNDPWLAPGATQTSGNNADAYADIASPDGFTAGDFRATTTSPGVFDRTYDLNLAPGANANQQMATITQAFYTVNFLHDWYYDSGFNEALGNAQANNFGRGGAGGDAMLVEVQDFGGTNNANMSTPSDGSSPKMQLYVFIPGLPGQLPGLTAGVVVSGPGLAGIRLAGTASFGPQTFNLTGQVVEAVDAIAPASDGCSALTNGASVTGKIALIDRGTCTFNSKVKTAQDAGAIGVLVVDNVVSAIPPGMGGSDPSIVIPSLAVTKAFGDSVRAALGSGVVTITLDRPAAIVRDGGLDNQAIAHEWGHYISHRLAGSLGNTMGQALGEGWSDFHALMMTVRPEDAVAPANANFAGTYSFAGYSVSSPYSLSYYFGSRRLPYSTNLLKNPLTFKHISDSETLPSGFNYQATGGGNSEVHNAGEIWCTMLWECYAALLRDTGRLTFAQAQLRMRDYLVAAYQLTPNTPTLLEARDALLAVAMANDAADYVAFWQAFAKRGAGMGAIAPDRNSSTNSPVTESYVAGGDLRFVTLSINDDFKSCDHDGYLDEGEIGTLTVTLQNIGAISLSATTGTASSTNPAIQFPDGNSIVFSPSTPLGLATGTVKIGLSGSTSLAAASIQVAFEDAAQVTPHPVNGSRTLYVRANDSASSTESFEKEDLPWTKGGFSTIEDGTFSRLEVTPTSHKLFGPDPSGVSDQWIMTPPLDCSSGTFTVSFQHYYSFERASGVSYDGGVIEVSTDDGLNWADASMYGAVPYTGVLSASTGNPLAGRLAFVGRTFAYPSPINATINFGTSLAGQTVRIRFRVGTDEGVSAPGWVIDNVALTGVTNAPFFSITTDPNDCQATAVADGIPTSLEFAVEGAMPSRGNVPLSFALPEAGVVEIAVFDVTGRRVETLANGNFAAGRHRLAWSRARSLGSGVYFVRMTAGGRTFTRRVVTLK